MFTAELDVVYRNHISNTAIKNKPGQSLSLSSAVLWRLIISSGATSRSGSALKQPSQYPRVIYSNLYLRQPPGVKNNGSRSGLSKFTKTSQLFPLRSVNPYHMRFSQTLVILRNQQQLFLSRNLCFCFLVEPYFSIQISILYSFSVFKHLASLDINKLEILPASSLCG